MNFYIGVFVVLIFLCLVICFQHTFSQDHCNGINFRM